MLVPCGVWASAGSRSSGRCGDSTDPTMSLATRTTKSTAAPGFSRFFRSQPRQRLHEHINAKVNIMARKEPKPGLAKERTSVFEPSSKKKHKKLLPPSAEHGRGRPCHIGRGDEFLAAGSSAQLSL